MENPPVLVVRWFTNCYIHLVGNFPASHVSLREDKPTTILLIILLITIICSYVYNIYIWFFFIYTYIYIPSYPHYCIYVIIYIYTYIIHHHIPWPINNFSAACSISSKFLIALLNRWWLAIKLSNHQPINPSTHQPIIIIIICKLSISSTQNKAKLFGESSN